MSDYKVINSRARRIDTPAKATGRAIYVDDISKPGMLHGALLQSSYAHAKIEDKSDESNNIKATKINVNAVIGYQMITSGGFTLDVFTGMGLVSKKWDISGQDAFDVDTFKDKSSITIPFGVSFGYAF